MPLAWGDKRRGSGTGFQEMRSHTHHSAWPIQRIDSEGSGGYNAGHRINRGRLLMTVTDHFLVIPSLKASLSRMALRILALLLTSFDLTWSALIFRTAAFNELSRAARSSKAADLQ